MATIYAPILSLPVAVGLNGQEWVPLVQGGTTKRAQSQTMVGGAINANFPAAIEFVTGVLGGGTLGIGRAGWLTVPFGCTINTATMLTNSAGSIVMDVWKTTYAGFPTVGSSNSITNSNPPTIAGGVQYQDTLLSGWTTSLGSSNILVFNVNSATGVAEVTLSLSVTRSLGF